MNLLVKNFVTKLLILIILSTSISEICGRMSKELKVKLSHGGIVIGRHLTSLHGRDVRGFIGIPYAKPPVNELRFKDPVAAAWKGERLAIKDSSLCVQRNSYIRETELSGNEDCLYLNVFVPHRPRTTKKLPVMIFFHGGGWQCNGGMSAQYGPDFLMDHDVIFVSGNYRLGPLGFLSSQTLDCPGNFGLKDQVEMLKWVQNNIEHFGGDKHSVTIFGESAGGASVTYHMMSKLSKGLFHKGISESGVYFNPWAQPPHEGIAVKRATTLAKKFNCYYRSNWNKTIQCLRKVSSEDITAAYYDFFEWDTDPTIPFPPVIEPEYPNAFITTHPRDEDEPHGLSIPLIAGITSEEGTLKTAAVVNIPELLEDFKTNFDKALPISLNYDHHDVKTQKEMTRKIDNFYFNGNHHWSRKNHQNLTNLYSDSWFLNGLEEYLQLRLRNYDGNNDADHGDNRENAKVAPTYVYLLDHKGQASFTEIFHGGAENYYGSCHAEELQYLFPVGKELFMHAIPTEKDHQVRKTMLQLWVNFAKYGNPTPEPLHKIKWPEITSYPYEYLWIGNKKTNSEKVLEVAENLYRERADFWYELRPHVPAKHYKDEL